jgi:hypothetical protein
MPSAGEVDTPVTGEVDTPVSGGDVLVSGGAVPVPRVVATRTARRRLRAKQLADARYRRSVQARKLRRNRARNRRRFGTVSLPHARVGARRAAAFARRHAGHRYFKRSPRGDRYVSLGRGVSERRTRVHGMNVPMCVVRRGRKYVVATYEPCFRLDVRRGQLVPVSREYREAHQISVVQGGPGKPDDPRMVWSLTRKTWVRKAGLKSGTYVKRANGVWYRRGGNKFAYVAGRWVSPRVATKRYIDAAYADNPYMRKARGGKWTCRKGGRKWRYVGGLWHMSLKSKRVYFGGQWRTLREARRLQRRRGRLGQGRLRGKKLRRKWRPTKVYRNGAYEGKTKGYVGTRGSKVARSQLGAGNLTPDVKNAVQAQVRANFARFMSWFISNYMRGGHYMDKSFLAKKIVENRSKFNVEPLPEPKNEAPKEVGLIGPAVFARPPNQPEKVLVDGMTEEQELRLARHAKLLREAIARGKATAKKLPKQTLDRID